MTDSKGQHLERLARMRGDFDENFRAVATPGDEDTEAFLIVRLGDQSVAIRLAELSGFEVAPQVIPVPIDQPALMGVSRVGGKLLPVYQLGILTGRTASTESRHWIAICGLETPVALAVDGLVGHVDTPRAARQPAGSAAERHVTELLRLEDGFQPIIDLPSVLIELEFQTSGRRSGAGSTPLEGLK